MLRTVVGLTGGELAVVVRVDVGALDDGLGGGAEVVRLGLGDGSGDGLGLA